MLKNQMTVLKVRGLEKSFHLRKVLDNIDFDIKNGERIGLVGYNGTGKTTLAKILFSKLNPDKGIIEKVAKVKIGYLSQSIDYEISDIHQSLSSSLDKDLFHLAGQMGLQTLSNLEERRISYLSGGEKLKLLMSIIWASKPEFLILDEPTNHLDLQGINWLVKELKKFSGAVLVISHDRHFLDKTVNRIFELEDGKMHFYNGNYSDYQKEKQKKVENLIQQYKVQKRQIEKIERQMEQLQSWSDNAHRNSTKQERDRGPKEFHRVKAKKRDNQIKSKMQRLKNELEKNKVEKPMEEVQVRFQFDSQGKRGKRIIEANRLSKSFDSHTLFKSSHFYINDGERIGLIGGNGSGKSTLIKMILGKEGLSDGSLWRSESIKIAYLSQEVDDLPAEKTIIEALGFTDRESILKARTLLANLGLKEQFITKRIDTLSLGERTRVKLVDMLMREYDVLILDEPTNHLDLPSREQLERTLSEFTGTIITVSHDYYFLNKLCSKVLAFDNQLIKRFEMKPEEYFNKMNSKASEKEDLMIMENKIASILGHLSLIDKNDPKYEQLDKEFNHLIQQKKNLLS